MIKLDENRAGDKIYWKLLTFEILFLWSVLSSIQNDCLSIIIEGKFTIECTISIYGNDAENRFVYFLVLFYPIDCRSNEFELIPEPTIGVRELILGSAYVALRSHQLAIAAFTECIAKREKETVRDMHITAFAHYELATILIYCHANVSYFTKSYSSISKLDIYFIRYLHEMFPGQDTEAMHRAKTLLQKAQQFQNYDLESRLCVQIQEELRKIT